MEEHSIEDWFHMYEKDITNFLVYYTGSADVEDLVQDTFLQALKKMQGFKGGSHPKTWLISIARNMVIDRHRRSMVWRKIRHIFSSDQQPHENGSEHLALKNEEHRQLYGAISQLSPPYRETVILRGILELSAKEAGEVLKCTPNKVHVTYHRSLKRLREILEKEGFRLEGYGAYSGKSKESS